MKKNVFLSVIILSLLLAPVFSQKRKTSSPKKNTKPVPAAVNPTTTKSPEAKTAVDRLKKNPSPKQKKEAVVVYNEDFVKGEELFVLNKPEEAIVYFEKSLESPNVDPKVYVYLGVCYYQIEKYDKSLAVCVQGMAKEDTDKKILAYNAGNSCYAMGNYMRADASYAIALKEDENYSPAVLNRANAQLKLDHLGDARDNYIKYLEMEPETPQRERIEALIALLEAEIARRANEKPELVNPEFNVENEKMELPVEPERVVADDIPQEKVKNEKTPSEIVHADSVAPELPKESKDKKPMELVDFEKIASSKKDETLVVPELVGPDGEAPFIPPEQLRIVPVAPVAVEVEEKPARSGEKLRIDEDLRRFEEEYRREMEESRKAAEAKAAAEAEEKRRKAAEEERLAEEKRRKAAEEEERLAAQKRALEEERRNLEKARMDAELEAQKRAIEEEKRRMEESRRAFEEEQKRIAEENRRKMEAEAKLAEEKRKLEDARRELEAEARRKAEAEERRRIEEEHRRAEEERRKAEEAEARRASEEAAKAEEAKRKAEVEKWPSPKASLLVEGGEKFTPDGDGRNDVVTFRPEVQYLEEDPESWEISIMDPKGNPFRTISGTGKIPSSIEWDGKGDTGENVVSRNIYSAKISIVPSKKDRLRSGEMKVVDEAKINTGLLLEVIVPEHEWKIVVQSIAFDPNAAGFNNVTLEQKLSNAQTLDEVAEEIRELSKTGAEVNIIIEGYANNISGTEKEQREELLPMSQKRAETIVKELIKRGIDPKLLTPKGVGGANPIADRNDRANWWKNRRVEFRIKQ